MNELGKVFCNSCKHLVWVYKDVFKPQRVLGLPGSYMYESVTAPQSINQLIEDAKSYLPTCMKNVVVGEETYVTWYNRREMSITMVEYPKRKNLNNDCPDYEEY